MKNPQRGGKNPAINSASPLDLEVERLLRGVPQSDGGSMHELAESWEDEEMRLARSRDQAAEDAAKQENIGED